jgi:hypothetical protein
MHARQYDPATGRFLSTDPLGTPDISQYSYVGDNPLGFTDPTGMHRASGTGLNPCSGRRIVCLRDDEADDEACLNEDDLVLIEVPGWDKDGNPVTVRILWDVRYGEECFRWPPGALTAEPPANKSHGTTPHGHHPYVYKP